MASFLFKYVKIRNGVEDSSVISSLSVYADTQAEAEENFYRTHPEDTVRVIEIKER